MTIELELTRNYVALIDEVDADLAAHKWYADVRAGTLIYVKRGSGPRNRRTTELLHRIILERMLGRQLLQGEFTDHADGNGLNNTRSNLRLATRAQNNANVRRKKTNRSGYKGVYAVSFPYLRAKALPIWAARYPLRSARNKTYTTYGLIVPVADFARCASKTFDLRQELPHG